MKAQVLPDWGKNNSEARPVLKMGKAKPGLWWCRG